MMAQVVTLCSSRINLCSALHLRTRFQQGSHLRSLLDAMTRSQSLTLCFFKNFFVRYLRYLYKHEPA